MRRSGQCPLLVFTQPAGRVVGVDHQIADLLGGGVGATYDGLRQQGVLLGAVELACSGADAPVDVLRLQGPWPWSSRGLRREPCRRGRDQVGDVAGEVDQLL